MNMRTRRVSNRPKAIARGFALILAIFLLVSLTAIGAMLLTVSNSQTESSIADVDGARAYLAARSGADWGAYQLLRQPALSYASNCRNTGSATQTVSFAGALSGFHVAVGCTSLPPATEGAATVTVFSLQATGCNDSGGTCPGAVVPGYVERQLQLSVTD